MSYKSWLQLQPTGMLSLSTNPVWETATSITEGATGEQYSMQLFATNTKRYEALEPLPRNLQLSTWGMLSGIPAATGAFTFVVRAWGSAAFSDRQFRVTFSDRPTWVTASLPDIRTGLTVTLQLEAQYATSYALIDGYKLPSGIQLSSSGLLQGTPLLNGTFSLAIRAYNTSYTFSDCLFSWTVAPDVTWVTSSIDDMAIDEALRITNLTAVNASTYSLLSGSLPPGITMSSAGSLTGSPSKQGRFALTIQASVTPNIFANKTFDVLVVPRPVWMSPATFIGDVAVGEECVLQLIALNASMYTSNSGAAVVNLDTLVFKSLVPGNVEFTVTAQGDSTQVTATRTFYVNVYGKPVWVTTGLPDAALNELTSIALTANGASTYALVSGAVPGMDLTSKGLVGTPSTAGTYHLLVRAYSGSAAIFADATFTLTVAPRPVWETSGSLADVPINTGLSVPLKVASGVSAYFEAQFGAIPGLTVQKAGTLTGTVNAEGTFLLVIRAINSTCPSIYADRQFTIVVAVPPTWQTAQLADVAANEVLSVQMFANRAQAYESTSILLNGTAVTDIAVDAVGKLGGIPNLSGTYVLSCRAYSVLSRVVYTDTSLSLVVADRPVWKTNVILPNSPVSQAVTLTLVATSAVKYAVLNNDAIWKIANSGTLTGTPTEAKSYTFTVRAVSSLSDSIYADRTFSLTASNTPAWVTSQLEDAVLGVSYDLRFSAVSASTYSKVSGVLPSGLSLDPATGRLYGIPTEVSNKTFTIRAYNTPDVFVDRAFSLRIAAKPEWITASLDDIPSGVAWSKQLVVAYAGLYSQLVDRLATVALALNSSTGVISGTPNSNAVVSFTVRAFAVDSTTIYTDRDFTLRIAARPTWTTVALQDVVVNTAQTIQLVASNCTAYSVVDGSLPHNTGFFNVPTSLAEIRGTPDTVSVSTFTVRALTASLTIYADQTFTLRVVSLPVWQNASTLDDAAVDEPYGAILKATNTETYENLTDLPRGLSLNSLSGLLSGVTKDVGTCAFSVRAYALASRTVYVDKQFSLLVARRPVWPVINLEDVYKDVAFNKSVLASFAGSYALTYGVLPAGITFSAGLLSGTPTTTGYPDFMLTAFSTTSSAISADVYLKWQVCAIPVWVTPGVLPDVAKGDPYSVTFDASNKFVFAIVAGTKPPLLNESFNADSGVFSGTTTTAGTTKFTVRVFARESATLFVDREFTQLVAVRPSWVTASVSDVEVNVAVNQTVTANDVIRYEKISGPAWLTVSDSGGILSGTPTQTGDVTLTVRAYSKTSAAIFADRSFSFVVASRPVWSTAEYLGVYVKNGSYSAVTVTASATGGTLSYSPSNNVDFALSSASAGVITRSVTATNTTARGLVLSVARTFSVTFADVSWSTGPDLGSVAYNMSLPSISASASSGASVSYSGSAFGVTAGSSGQLSGVPNATGGQTLTVTGSVSGVNGSLNVNRDFYLRVVAAPAWSTGTDLGTKTTGDAVDMYLQATCFNTVQYSRTGGSLPGGLSLAADGRLTGSVNTASGYSFEVQAAAQNMTYGQSLVANRTFTMTVNNSTGSGSGSGSGSALQAYPPVGMTSASCSLTASYGSGTYVASSSTSSGSTALGFKCFDKDNSTYWESVAVKNDGTYWSGASYVGTVSTTYTGGSQKGEWIQLQTPSAIVVQQLTVLGRYIGEVWTNRTPKNFTLLGSNNGSTWSLIATSSNNSYTTGNTTTITLTRNNSTAYSYHRMVIYTIQSSTATYNCINIAELAFWAPSSTSTSTSTSTPTPTPLPYTITFSLKKTDVYQNYPGAYNSDSASKNTIGSKLGISVYQNWTGFMTLTVGGSNYRMTAIWEMNNGDKGPPYLVFGTPGGTMPVQIPLNVGIPFNWEHTAP